MKTEGRFGRGEGGKDKEGNGKHKGYFWKFLELIF
jgi:hypothetical protein